METKNVYEISSITASHKLILIIEAKNQSEAFNQFALKNKLYLKPEYAIVIRYLGKAQLEAQSRGEGITLWLTKKQFLEAQKQLL